MGIKFKKPEKRTEKWDRLEKLWDEFDTLKYSYRKPNSYNTYLLIKENKDCDGIDKELENNSALKNRLKELDDERIEIEKYNIGGESLLDNDLKRIKELSENVYENSVGESVHLLNDNEVENLQISRGTLNGKEREIINNHVSMTITMM